MQGWEQYGIVALSLALVSIIGVSQAQDRQLLEASSPEGQTVEVQGSTTQV